MDNKVNMNSIVKALEKEFFLGDDVIVSVRGEEGTASFLGEKVGEFFEIFDKAPEVEIVIWLVPKYSVEFSLLGETMPATIDDVSQIIGKGTDPVSLKEMDKLLEELQRIKGVYLKEGGLLLAGTDLDELITVGKIMEKAALVHIEGKHIGEAKPFPDEEAEENRKNYIENYSRLRNVMNKLPKKEVFLKEEDIRVRKEIQQVGNKLIANNLAISTWGNISVKINEDWILVTPSGIPYDSLTPEDMDMVNMKTKYKIGRLKPTSEKDLHIEIYKTRPEAGAIVHSHGLYSSVFASMGKTIPIMNKKMKEAVNGPLNMVPYSKSGSEKLAKDTGRIMKKFDVKGVNLKAHGTVNYGKTLQEAFENCCIIDKAAKIYIDRKKGIY